ncbi:hypothetical protein A2U01_0085811, partial [Trifolium medium]|nr:hypothetical protein [Trifolium medium]
MVASLELGQDIVAEDLDHRNNVTDLADKITVELAGKEDAVRDETRE